MNTTTDSRRIAGRNMRFGWLALLLFATLGIALESMHGFKVGWYLDVGNEVRRLMWRLAHAHGGLLAIVNILYALVAGSQEEAEAERVAKASPLLMAAALLLPLGFFLGGIWTHGGDPFIGILLVPVGALCFLAGLALTAFGLRRSE